MYSDLPRHPLDLYDAFNPFQTLQNSQLQRDCKLVFHLLTATSINKTIKATAKTSHYMTRCLHCRSYTRWVTKLYKCMGLGSCVLMWVRRPECGPQPSCKAGHGHEPVKSVLVEDSAEAPIWLQGVVVLSSK